jgi:hypothetical protein
MEKKYLGLTGLTQYDARIKDYISGMTYAVDDKLAQEIYRAQQAEDSLYNVLSGITEYISEGVDPFTGITSAQNVLISNTTRALYPGSPSTVDDAMQYAAPDSSLTINGRAAESRQAGLRIGALESKIGEYTLAAAMTEDQYNAIEIKDNNTLYFILEED